MIAEICLAIGLGILVGTTNAYFWYKIYNPKPKPHGILRLSDTGEPVFWPFYGAIGSGKPADGKAIARMQSRVVPPGEKTKKYISDINDEISRREKLRMMHTGALAALDKDLKALRLVLPTGRNNP